MSEWHYARNGERFGPVAEERLRAMLREGEVGWADLVWREGMAGWAEARSTPELMPAGMRAPAAEAPVAETFTTNPFQTPLAPLAAEGDAQGMEGALEALRGTRPWVLFLAILGVVGNVLVVGLGLVVIGMATVLAQGVGRGLPPFVGPLYLAMAAINIAPIVFLFRYASRIRRAVEDRGRSLARALEAQRSFWRYMGVLALVVTIIYGLIFIVGITLGVIMAGRHH